MEIEKVKKWIEEKGIDMVNSLCISVKPSSNVKITSHEASFGKYFTLEPEQNVNNNVKIFYLHGGSYCMGVASLYTNLVSQLCDFLGLSCVISDYPKTYPESINHLENVFKEFFGKNDKIILMGDSAGGGLVLSLAHRLIVNKNKNLLCCVTISPWLDLRDGGYEHGTFEEPYYTDMRMGYVNLYTKFKQLLDNPEISPIKSNLLNDMPIYIEVGEHDYVREQCEQFKLFNPNNVTLNVVAGADHDWILIHNENDLTKKTFENFLGFVRQFI